MLLNIKFNFNKFNDKKILYENHLLVPNYEIITHLKFGNSWLRRIILNNECIKLNLVDINPSLDEKRVYKIFF